MVSLFGTNPGAAGSGTMDVADRSGPAAAGSTGVGTGRIASGAGRVSTSGGGPLGTGGGNMRC
jgi:hypothetical protein